MHVLSNELEENTFSSEEKQKDKKGWGLPAGTALPLGDAAWIFIIPCPSPVLLNTLHSTLTYPGHCGGFSIDLGTYLGMCWAAPCRPASLGAAQP